MQEISLFAIFLHTTDIVESTPQHASSEIVHSDVELPTQQGNVM